MISKRLSVNGNEISSGQIREIRWPRKNLRKSMKLTRFFLIRRKKYDRFGHAGVDPNSGFGGGAGGFGGFGGFEDIFDMFGGAFGGFGGGSRGRRNNGPKKGQ